ncbi:hypothetical protein B9Z55_027473 [Caenorhabditis nigoni]|nr:hypothetical protein B9Z55_027473 [Caenorhabditis nigoni]
MSLLESPASQKEGHSLISKELRKGFADFSDRLKADGLSKTFVSDEISKLEKLENDLEVKKKVLESRIDQKKIDFWIPILLLIFLMVLSIFTITYNTIHPPEDETGPWPIIAFKIAAVILLFLFGFTVFEAIIANWKRQRNARKTFSLEDGNEKNGKIFFIATDYDDLKNRYKKLLEEDYVPMWNRYKRLCNQFIFYYIVGILIGLMIVVSTVVDCFFYNAEQDPQKTFMGIGQLFVLILSPLLYYRNIMNTIAEDNEIQF